MMYMYISLIHIQLYIKKFVTKFLLLQAICGFSVCIISPCGRGLLYLYTHVEITTTQHFVQFLSPNLYELSFDENLATLKFPAMCYYDTCTCGAVLVMNDMVWIDAPWHCATSVTNHTHNRSVLVCMEWILF